MCAYIPNVYIITHSIFGVLAFVYSYSKNRRKKKFRKRRNHPNQLYSQKFSSLIQCFVNIYFEKNNIDSIEAKQHIVDRISNLVPFSMLGGFVPQHNLGYVMSIMCGHADGGNDSKKYKFHFIVVTVISVWLVFKVTCSTCFSFT